MVSISGQEWMRPENLECLDTRGSLGVALNDFLRFLVIVVILIIVFILYSPPSYNVL